MGRQSNNCPVACFEADIDCGGHPFRRCNVCGTHAGNPCRLSEEAITVFITSERIRREAQGRHYDEMKDDTNKLVKQLIADEREAANKPIVTTAKFPGGLPEAAPLISGFKKFLRSIFSP